MYVCLPLNPQTKMDQNFRDCWVDVEMFFWLDKNGITYPGGISLSEGGGWGTFVYVRVCIRDACMFVAFGPNKLSGVSVWWLWARKIGVGGFLTDCAEVMQ